MLYHVRIAFLWVCGWVGVCVCVCVAASFFCKIFIFSIILDLQRCQFLLYSSDPVTHTHIYIFFFLFFFFFCLFTFSRAVPVAYRGSQARRLIRAVATGLRWRHSNSRSKQRLQPTPQLMATPGP